MADVGNYELIDSSIESKFEYKSLLWPKKYKQKEKKSDWNLIKK